MTTSFLGIPIDGDIVRAERRVQQRPLGEFSPVIQAVLDDEHMTEFGWQQYTPYFNDGDPCVFSAGTPWFRTDAEAPGDDDDLYKLQVDYHPTLGTSRWDETARRHVAVELPADKAALSAKCQALAAAIEGGAFDDVLIDAFGDHADITIKRDGITVECYEHD